MPKICLARAALVLATAICAGVGCTNSTAPGTPSTGSLQITVSGLPVGAPAAIAVSGPSGFHQTVTATTTLSALQPGAYTITASDVTSAGISYAPTPASQGVNVQAPDTAATAMVTYHDTAEGMWTVKTPMPTARAGLGVGVVNGILYAVGGENGTQVFGTLEAYDPATSSWTGLASMPTARAGLRVGVVNGILYAVGGENGTQVLGTLEAYDPATNSWTGMASMPTARAGLGVGVVNGILYAVGGDDGTQYVRTVESYDPSTNTWTTLVSMPSPVGRLGVAVGNGILYAVGGSYLVAGRHFSSEDVEAYDPSANTWTRKAWMPTPRSDLGVGVIDGILYAVGGYYSDPSTTGLLLATVESYDPATNAWSRKASLPSRRAEMGAGVVNGALYAVGGVSTMPPGGGCRVCTPVVGFVRRVEAFTP